ncbi:MAG: hypothetical protein WC163_04900 [Sulfurovum sp.]|jgi:hypothetical protein
MKKIYNLLAIFNLLFLYGCHNPTGIEKNDKKYPPFFFKIGWSEKDFFKPENILEVKKAMLECGYCTPTGNCKDDYRVIWTREYTLKTRWFPRQCMIKSGFTSKAYYYDGKGYIKAPTQLKPDTRYGPVPDRSVERRLNSEWCTEIYPESEVCKP